MLARLFDSAVEMKVVSPGAKTNWAPGNGSVEAALGERMRKSADGRTDRRAGRLFNVERRDNA